MKKVLVTGGAGFIGSHLVDRLIHEGCSVSIIDNLSTGSLDNVNKNAKFYEMDIRDSEISKVFEAERPEYVFHHAAQRDVKKSLEDPVSDSDVNIIGTVNILENCRRYDVYKHIYPSSAAVYGMPEYLPLDELHIINPISYYGISKYTPEQYIKVYSDLCSMKYTIFRYANVYGIRQDPKGEGGVVAIFMERLMKGKIPVIYGDGEQTRDFIYVDDIVEANIKALCYGDNETLNISTNIPVSINELYSLIKDMLEIEHDAEHAGERAGDIRYSCLDNSKAMKLLDWKPKYSIKEGLRKTIDYYAKSIY